MFEIISVLINKPRSAGGVMTRLYGMASYAERRCMQLTNTADTGILIDEADVEVNRWRWHKSQDRYIIRNTFTRELGGLERRLHRLIACQMLGRELVPGEVVDHINGNGFDNRRSNLRVCTQSQNMRNQVNRPPGRSGYFGVEPLRCTFRAYVVLDRKQHQVGCFSTAEEAAWMRDQWALTLHGEFARLNFEYLPVAAQTNEAGLVKAAIGEAL